MASDNEKQQFPPQRQEQPGRRSEMDPVPQSRRDGYRPSGKLSGKKALITGGDSGIGRAVALLFAMEGADVGIVYFEEHEDAEDTKKEVEAEGRRCLTMAGDIGDEAFCRDCVERMAREMGGLHVLVNNSGEQHSCERIEDLSSEQMERTFRTNIFGMFHMVRAAMPHLKEGAAIVNTASVTAYQGHPLLVDYSATKGAIVSFTRSLAVQIADRGIRVNAVAPGPVWTPLIPASFEEEKVERFGSNTAMKRAGQPYEIAPCFLFLACEDSSFMTGQVLHPNGGRIVNG